jgi:DeoR/GlpR family transcriptional regulator of sugar metabolism
MRSKRAASCGGTTAGPPSWKPTSGRANMISSPAINGRRPRNTPLPATSPIITNSLPIAALFADLGSLETIVTGGSIDSRLGVLVGPLCEQSLGQMHADLAILSGAGVTAAGVWNHNALVVASQRRMIAAAERTLFALDGSKFGRKAIALTSAFTSQHTLITDRAPPPEISAALKSARATLALAPL